MTSVPARSGRVESESAAHLVSPGVKPKSANDSIEEKKSQNRPAAKRLYVTRTEVLALAARLSGRQQAVLSDIGRLGVLSGKQIQRLHYSASAAGGRLARKHLAELTRWRAITRLSRSIGGERAGSAGHVYALGVGGQRLLHPELKRYRPPWTPRPSYLRHALGVSEIYVGLRLAERSSAMRLVTFDTEPGCWRQFFGPGGARSTLKPDALTVVHIESFEDRYFIEADCDTEPGSRIATKAKNYIRHWQSGQEQSRTGIYPYVIWVAPNAARASFLTDALAGLPPEHWQLFQVTTMDQVASRIATGTSEPIKKQKEVRT